MPSVSIDCRFCKTSVVSHHYLTHILAKHKEPFIELFKNKFHSDIYDTKPIRLEICPNNSTFPYYCCMGCLTACKAEGAAKKHFDKPECKTKHLEFLLDVRHKYPKTGPKPSALALNPEVVRNVQKMYWELLCDLKKDDPGYKYDWYTKAFRKKIPIALDEATLTKLYGDSEEEEEEPKKEEEVDTDFLVIPKLYKSKREAFDLLSPEEQQMMLAGGYDPDKN